MTIDEQGTTWVTPDERRLINAIVNGAHHEGKRQLSQSDKPRHRLVDVIDEIAELHESSSDHVVTMLEQCGAW